MRENSFYYSLVLHKNPNQAARLVSRIASSTAQIDIHINNVSFSKLDWSSLCNMNGKNVFVHSRHGMNVWGSFDLTEEFIESMKRSLDFDYDYFINLSGQCYPIKSIKLINEFFNVNHSYSFVEHKRIPDYSWASDGCLNRFRYKYYRVPFVKILGYRPFSGKRYDSSILAGIQRFLIHRLSSEGRYDATRFARTPRILNRDIEKLNLYGGSTWFFLRRKHVEYILDFINNNRRIVSYFRRVWAPDEHFFQTILAGEYGKGEIKNENLRYIDWSSNGTEIPPRTLTIKDFDKIVNSGKLFARKFDENVDKEILDKIDDDILSE